MLQIKRRKLGSRAVWRFSTEMKADQWADIVVRMESDTWVYRYGEISHATAVFGNASHAVQ